MEEQDRCGHWWNHNNDGGVTCVFCGLDYKDFSKARRALVKASKSTTRGVGRGQTAQAQEEQHQDRPTEALWSAVGVTLAEYDAVQGGYELVIEGGDNWAILTEEELRELRDVLLRSLPPPGRGNVKRLREALTEAAEWLETRPDYTEGDAATASSCRAALTLRGKEAQP